MIETSKLLIMAIGMSLLTCCQAYGDGEYVRSTTLDELTAEDQYTAEINRRVMRNWRPLRICNDSYGKPMLFVELDANGQVSQLKILCSSGMVAQDQLAIKAVRDSAPFGSVPEEKNSFSTVLYFAEYLRGQRRPSTKVGKSL